MTVCESAFTVYLDRFKRIASYTAAVTPALSKHSDAISIFVDSNAVLMMAWHENFLKSIIAGAIRNKETEARRYFCSYGHGNEIAQGAVCGLPDLIAMGLRRVSYKNRGAAAEKLFSALAGFSLWPDAPTANTIADVNVIRQLVVHHGGASLGDDYSNQLTDSLVIETTRYGNLPPVRRINYHYCLTGFMKEAFLAFIKQAQHIHSEMLARPDWTQTS